MKFCKKKTNVVSNQTVKTITVLIEIIQNENSLSYPEIDKKQDIRRVNNIIGNL